MLYAIPYTNAVSDAEGSPQAAGMKRNKPEGAIDSSETPEDKKFKLEEAAPTPEPNPAVEGPSPAKSEGLSTLDKIESSRTFLLTIQPDETSAVAVSIMYKMDRFCSLVLFYLTTIYFCIIIPSGWTLTLKDPKTLSHPPLLRKTTSETFTT